MTSSVELLKRAVRGVFARFFLLIAVVLIARALVRAAPIARCDGAFTRLDSVESCGACGVRCAAVHASAACIEGRCVLACEADHADCDGHPGNGCEVDLKSDRAHCGSCVRSCGGARCAAGSCVARRMGNGKKIAADASAVYAFGESVVRYPLDGSEASVLTSDASPPASTAERAAGSVRLVDGEVIYTAEAAPGGGAAVRRAPKSGGEVVTVVTHPYAIRDLAVNATHVFWVDERDRIFMAPKTLR
ncbi:Hypothetical protein A7982_08516 [Minicystis rosea]|nr:Hypothetical protein A7982_08516 [Minicystis rosea]